MQHLEVSGAVLYIGRTVSKGQTITDELDIKNLPLTCDVLTVMMNIIFDHYFIHYSRGHNHCT
jgi:hypothetical protein